MEQKYNINYLRRYYKEYMYKYNNFKMIHEHDKSCKIFNLCDIDVKYNNCYEYYKCACVTDNLITSVSLNDKLTEYNVEEYKIFIVIIKKLSDIINYNLPFINELIMDSDLSHKEIRCKIINVFKSRHKILFNKEIKMNVPELEIYNRLIKFKKLHSNIINVCYNVKLPVKFIGNLRADFVITIKQNNFIEAIIIEYDDPTHTDHTHPHFNNNNIYRDLIKNNFCIKNKINMLRIDHKQNYIELVDAFINEKLLQTTKKPYIKFLNMNII